MEDQMKKRFALLFVLLAITALLIAACQPQAPAEEAVVEEPMEEEAAEEEPMEEEEMEEEPMEDTRGSDGTVSILYWQAASTMNPYLSGGTKDIHAASLVLEPLARYDENGNFVPWLVEEIPTVENGGVAEDLTSITWKLKEGVLWSDGTPLTAEDVVFTGEYCLDEEMGCNALSKFLDVESIEAVDDLTVTITFSRPKPFPYGPFVGAESPVVQKAQFADCMGAKAQECTEQNFGPIGTGPFVVTEFLANDTVVYAANENFREEGKPYFAEVIFKGGGDAASAARAVLETGEADYAWNLQVEPQILTTMEAAGQGVVVTGFGNAVERLMVNFTNPDPALGDARSAYVDADGDLVADEPHPFLSDYNVRRALSWRSTAMRSFRLVTALPVFPAVTCCPPPLSTFRPPTTSAWCKMWMKPTACLMKLAGSPAPMASARRMASA
jgi:peptide/nickel transport system substrate-binding protein